MVVMVLSLIDGISRVLAWLAMLFLLIMIGLMMYEVVDRYAFAHPNLWAFDIPWMLSGASFLVAGAFTLQVEGHVRIDFLSTRMPLRVQHLVNFIFYIVLFLPLISTIIYFAGSLTWKAYVTGEFEMMSAWQPLIWPFYLSIFVGFAALWLQCFASAIRHVMGMREPASVLPPGQSPPY